MHRKLQEIMCVRLIYLNNNFNIIEDVFRLINGIFTIGNMGQDTI
jgi:hypothetical protein